jgi:hypothetical protein
MSHHCPWTLKYYLISQLYGHYGSCCCDDCVSCFPRINFCWNVWPNIRCGCFVILPELVWDIHVHDLIFYLYTHDTCHMDIVLFVEFHLRYRSFTDKVIFLDHMWVILASSLPEKSLDCALSRELLFQLFSDVREEVADPTVNFRFLASMRSRYNLVHGIPESLIHFIKFNGCYLFVDNRKQ